MMFLNKHRAFYICLVAMLVFIATNTFVVTVSAQEIEEEAVTSETSLGYTPLTPIPGLDSETDYSLAEYLNAMFRLFLGIATILAVIMIVVAGIKYGTSDSESGTTAAKKQITDALWGLLLALGAWLILYTVNPTLLEFRLEIEPIEGTEVSVPTPGPGGNTCAGCVPIPSSVNVKSGACSGGGVCQVSSDLAPRLNTLSQRLSGQNITWQVTEAWPPTVNHQNPCHNRGTCVDANFTGTSNKASNVRHFIDAASDSGLTACYEVRTQGDKDRLVDEFGAPPSNVAVIPDDPETGEPRITGMHFSVYGGRTGCF